MGVGDPLAIPWCHIQSSTHDVSTNRRHHAYRRYTSNFVRLLCEIERLTASRAFRAHCQPWKLLHVRTGAFQQLRPFLLFSPVLSDSTCASFTAPFSVTRAYLLERSPPKMAAPSKDKSRALVNRRSGSARKRIWRLSTLICSSKTCNVPRSILTDRGSWPKLSY